MDKIQLTKTFGVYQIKCLINSKIYVGSTSKSFSVRWKQWKSDLNRGKGNAHLRNAWNLYGEEQFEFTVLEIVEDKEQVLIREQFYIDTLNPEYNFMKEAKAGRLDSKDSDETRSKRLGRIPWNKGLSIPGTPHTEESKANISKAKKGKLLSEEHKVALRKPKSDSSNMGIKAGSTWSEAKRESMKNKILSEEHKAKIAQAHRDSKMKAPPSHKGIKRSEEFKRKLSEARKGINNPNYKDK